MTPGEALTLTSLGAFFIQQRSHFGTSRELLPAPLGDCLVFQSGLYQAAQGVVLTARVGKRRLAR